MAFSYYARLNPAQKRIYERSAALTEIPIRQPARFGPALEALRAALASDARAEVEAASLRIYRGLNAQTAAPPLALEVLAARPHNRFGELHGLYTLVPGRTPAIQLWMRTAVNRRPVAFKTYLRTLCHEFCHHHDYAVLKLGDSFHTEGFFARGESIFRQLSSPPGDESEKLTGS